LLTALAAAIAPAALVPRSARADAIDLWNNTLVGAINSTSALLYSGPPEVAREMAMVDTAMFDAVNAASGSLYQGFAYSGTVSGASADAAALAAGYTVMNSIFTSPVWNGSVPTSVTTAITAAYQSGLAGLNQSDPSVASGLALGAAAGQAMIAKRATDGSAQAITAGLQTYTPPGSGTVPGVYVPPATRPAMFPTWGTVTPFGLTTGTVRSIEQTVPIPSVNSAAYAQSVFRTECVGNVSALPGNVAAACGEAGLLPTDAQKAAQTQAAYFWNDPGGTNQPPGHWLLIAETVAQSQNLDELQKARETSLVAVAEADAAIGAWDLKYQTNLWRPNTAINDPTDWSNGIVVYDPTWTSIIATPPHPDFVAGHPAFSEAAATVLQSFFGTDEIPFCSTSTPYINRPNQTPIPAITECFDGFQSAATEAGESRVWGGIHTDLATQGGQTLGLGIGEALASTLFLPVPEPATMALALPMTAGLVGARRLSRKARGLS
jgi:hypothetical protein